MVRRRPACETTPARPMATLKMFVLTKKGDGMIGSASFAVFVIRKDMGFLSQIPTHHRF